MKTLAINCLFLFCLSSCTSTTRTSNEEEKTKNQAKETAQTEKFDLLKITFKEPLEKTLKNSRLSTSAGKSPVSTLMGYDVFVSSSPKLLNFDGQPLTGKSDTFENQLVLHYTSNEKIISAFEVQLYTTDAVNKVNSGLEHKFGKASFTEDSSSHPGVAIDMNGNMMDGPKRTVRFQRWERKDTGIYYYLVQHSVSGNLRFAEFMAINMKDKDAEKWIRFKAYNFYDK